MHAKAYSFEVADRGFDSATFEWAWGCDCLSAARIRLDDYATRLRANEAFVPCMTEVLGTPSHAQTPWTWTWAGAEGRPKVTLSPQETIRIDFKPEVTREGFGEVMGALATCAEELAPVADAL